MGYIRIEFIVEMMPVFMQLLLHLHASFYRECMMPVGGRFARPVGGQELDKSRRPTPQDRGEWNENITFWARTSSICADLYPVA